MSAIKSSSHSPHASHGAPHHEGRCFCGSVEFTLTGEPAAMGFCHCDSCRAWSASPVNAFTLWKPETLKVTKGQELIATYSKTPGSQRKWCKSCGGHLFNNHPGLGLVDVYAAVVPGLRFKPGVHVNYENARLRMADGLPKMKDFPAEMGGSGAQLPE